MGFLDSLGHAAKNVNESLKKRNDERFIKEMILERMDIADIKILCKRNDVGDPSNEDFFTGKKVRLVKKDFIVHAAANLGIETIKDFARKKKIKFDDLLVEERHMEKERTKWRSNTEEWLDLTGEKESHFDEVIKAINKFEPSKRYNEEFPYQIELTGFLKHKFPNVAIEVQAKRSRPDIVIDNAAIEIKGPTLYKDLATIFDKCTRYTKNWDHFIVVLFAVEVKEDQYKDWEKSLKKHFPDVVLVKNRNLLRMTDKILWID